MTNFEITAVKTTTYTFTVNARDEEEADKIIDTYIDDDFNDVAGETREVKWMITIDEQESDDDDEEGSNEEDGDWMDGDALASAGFGTDEDYGG